MLNYLAGLILRAVHGVILRGIATDHAACVHAIYIIDGCIACDGISIYGIARGSPWTGWAPPFISD